MSIPALRTPDEATTASTLDRSGRCYSAGLPPPSLLLGQPATRRRGRQTPVEGDCARPLLRRRPGARRCRHVKGGAGRQRWRLCRVGSRLGGGRRGLARLMWLVGGRTARLTRRLKKPFFHDGLGRLRPALRAKRFTGRRFTGQVRVPWATGPVEKGATAGRIDASPRQKRSTTEHAAPSVARAGLGRALRGAALTSSAAPAHRRRTAPAAGAPARRGDVAPSAWRGTAPPV